MSEFIGDDSGVVAEMLAAREQARLAEQEQAVRHAEHIRRLAQVEQAASERKQAFQERERAKLVERRATAARIMPDFTDFCTRADTISRITGIDRRNSGVFTDQQRWYHSAEPIEVASQDGITEQVEITTMKAREGSWFKRMPRYVGYRATYLDTETTREITAPSHSLWLQEDGTFGDYNNQLDANRIAIQAVFNAVEEKLGIERQAS